MNEKSESEDVISITPKHCLNVFGIYPYGRNYRNTWFSISYLSSDSKLFHCCRKVPILALVKLQMNL